MNDTSDLARQMTEACKAPAKDGAPVEVTLTITARLYTDAMVMREEACSGTLGEATTELAVNLCCGPLRDTGMFIVRVGDRWALLDNESLVRAVAAVQAAPEPQPTGSPL